MHFGSGGRMTADRYRFATAGDFDMEVAAFPQEGRGRDLARNTIGSEADMLGPDGQQDMIVAFDAWGEIGAWQSEDAEQSGIDGRGFVA